MNPTKLASIGLAASLAAVLPAIPAQATLLTRTFVSSAGSNSNPCTITQPCASFATAYGLTAPNGIIAALDPGKYGPLTITGPITINGYGWASITAPAGGNGITITANSGDNVTLIGLAIDGAGAGNIGIFFNTGNTLSVESCSGRNLTHGLAVGNSTLTLAVTVSNSYFNSNTANGILLQPNGSGAITAAIDRTVLSGNGFAGLNLIGQTSTNKVRATVTNSVAANNINGSSGTGFLVQSALNQAAASLAVTNSSAIGNFIGISAFGPNAGMVIGQSTVSENTTGYSSNGFIFSYGDNYIDTTNGGNIGSLTATTKQ